MNEVQRLKKYMDDNGYSIRGIAEALGMSYDGMYQALFVRGAKSGRVSGNLKWRFAQRFGADVADDVFPTDISNVSYEKEFVTK